MQWKWRTRRPQWARSTRSWRMPSSTGTRRPHARTGLRSKSRPRRHIRPIRGVVDTEVERKYAEEFAVAYKAYLECFESNVLPLLAAEESAEVEKQIRIYDDELDKLRTAAQTPLGGSARVLRKKCTRRARTTTPRGSRPYWPRWSSAWPGWAWTSPSPCDQPQHHQAAGQDGECRPADRLGDLSQTVEVKSRDEIGQLARRSTT